MGIVYKSGYKYQLCAPYEYQLPTYFPPVAEEIDTDFIFLGQDNLLILEKGYACDGPSGPTIDTKNFMRGAFIHDCLYQLCREGYLEKNIYRPIADRILYDVIREDGMSWLRATYIYYGVRWCAVLFARKGTEKPPQTAP
jgi:hypothetical protein